MLLNFTYLGFFFFPLNHKQLCTTCFFKCSAPFTPTVRGNCATEGTRQSLKHGKEGLWALTLYFEDKCESNSFHTHHPVVLLAARLKLAECLMYC